MSDAVDLSAVELDRSELHVFVVGPGFGETIVVALPESGWIVIDGASHQGAFPARELLAAHLGDDAIEAMLLTHPHSDHYGGMRELIDDERLGPMIQRIGCVRALVEDDPASESPDVLDDVGKAQALLARIRSWWAEHPRGRVELLAGIGVIEHPQVSTRVLAPSEAMVEQFMEPSGRRGRIRQRANELSVVLELGFGDGRYLFTGDLPERQWRSILDREAELAEHSYLKLPHHGSEAALPDRLLSTRDTPRRWVLTPFNRGRRSSRPPTSSSLQRLLDYESELHLTAFPVAWRQMRPAPETTRLADIEDAPVGLRQPGLPRGTRISRRGRGLAVEALDCCWLLSFDRAGTLTSRRRGSVATRVVRD